MQTLTFSDATLRLMSKKTEQGPSFREKLEIAKALDRLHLDAIELPGIGNEKADPILIKSVSLAVKHSAVVLPAALTAEGVDRAAEALCEAAKPCVQIAVPTSAVQLEYVCHMKLDRALTVIDELVRRARQHGVAVEFVAEDATRSEWDDLMKALKTALSAGADAIVLSDTAGLMLSEEFAAFVRKTLEALPELAGRTLGVECADTLRVAGASAIAAACAGAQRIKIAAAGCGLPLLTDAAQIVRTRGADLNLAMGVQTTEMMRTVKQIDWILHSKKSSHSPFDSGVASSADGVRLDAFTTRGEIVNAVQKLGYDLSEEDNARVFHAFRLIAEKKDVSEKELDAIVASAALQVPPTYTLESYVINCGNILTATAHLKLKKGAQPMQGIGVGDGPVDASFLAIEQIIGHHYELDDFQIQAVTEGREAMGSSLVRLRSGGKLYSGKGISTDILGASILAYLNALNKIVYEETLRQ